MTMVASTMRRRLDSNGSIGRLAIGLSLIMRKDC
jgi:hypothetical protein